ncbi:hypothetical protein BJY59DRAFT_263005 [Rhodotorula toruloides]
MGAGSDWGSQASRSRVSRTKPLVVRVCRWQRSERACECRADNVQSVVVCGRKPELEGRSLAATQVLEGGRSRVLLCVANGSRVDLVARRSVDAREQERRAEVCQDRGSRRSCTRSATPNSPLEAPLPMARVETAFESEGVPAVLCGAPQCDKAHLRTDGRTILLACLDGPTTTLSFFLTASLTLTHLDTVCTHPASSPTSTTHARSPGFDGINDRKERARRTSGKRGLVRSTSGSFLGGNSEHEGGEWTRGLA